jgi:membrane protein implicated in regulation of membrane protease activity
MTGEEQMDSYVWWFVLAFGLAIAELMTGTFYLLVIALALGVAGLAALFGAGFSVQLLIATAIGVGGSLALRKSTFGRRIHASPADDPVQNMDVGQTVRIEQWSDHRARATYRGSQWDIELAAGETPAPGEFVIRAIQGNRLVVSRKLS